MSNTRTQRQTAAHIDLGAIRSNFAAASALAPAAKTLAVIKADAYGHGIVQVATALRDSAPMFGVATVDEAVMLRDGGIGNPILVLEGVTTRDATDLAREKELVLMLHSKEQVALLREAPVAVWIKVDTGMHRLGIHPDELAEVMAQLHDAAIAVDVICTHLACAEERDNDMTERQLAAFEQCAGHLGLPASIANSAGLIAWPGSRADWVRPGLLVYGVSPFDDDHTLPSLRPAMTFSSEVIAVREIPAGDTVGYGARWSAARDSIIATVAAGYADGYPRQAPNGTPVFVNGRVVPLVGTVSMDMITIDVTDHPGVATGDRVELWGANVPVSDVARRAGKISYELLTGLTPRVPRIYADNP